MDKTVTTSEQSAITCGTYQFSNMHQLRSKFSGISQFQVQYSQKTTIHPDLLLSCTQQLQADKYGNGIRNVSGVITLKANV